MTRLATDVGQRPQNRVLEGMFRPVEEERQEDRPIVRDPYIHKGDLVVFGYQFWLHDPWPLVIVTDIEPGFRVRGVNLHYLTYVNIRTILQQFGGNKMLSYQMIQGNPFLRASFRWYKWAGIQQIRKMDVNYLLQMMGAVGRYDPNKTKMIQDAVREQMNQQINRTAKEMTGKSIDTGRNKPTTGQSVPVVATTPTVGSQQSPGTQPGV